MVTARTVTAVWEVGIGSVLRRGRSLRRIQESRPVGAAENECDRL